MADHKQVVRTFLDALGEHDEDAMKPLVSSDVRWWPPPSVASRANLDRPIVGWSAVPWLGGGATRAFRPGTTKLTYHHVLEDGDLVSVHMTRESVGSNGRPYENEYNWLLRFEDGLIAEVWEVLDTAHAFSILDPS